MTMRRQVCANLRSRAPAAAQHEVMRCRAGAHAAASDVACWVPALRRIACALRRVRDTSAN
ncbi:hypothetical protein DAA51_28670 [Bradyrhizobium sp. WBAH10]|nr:hypothetical protein [Bradyrhizobium sp. WBAH30]QCJ77304.1 hypothetical protein DAA51_28670 [Bradyrhizobium sp. WBAH10]QCJ92061.1 hypothetical protein DAA57_28920 [Bradyrhizobium yuanmingense]